MAVHVNSTKPIRPNNHEIPIKGLEDSTSKDVEEDEQTKGSSSKDHAEVTEDKEEGKVEEARNSKMASTPKTPIPQEYRIHRLTHLPYRSWCSYCVRAKKKNPGHRRTRKEDMQGG